MARSYSSPPWASHVRCDAHGYRSSTPCKATSVSKYTRCPFCVHSFILAAGAGNTPLLHAARPVLQTLVSRKGEVALLSVQQGNRSLTVLREESHQSLRAGGWVGRSSPMHCTASGRALLFDSDDALVEELTANDLTAPMSALAAPATLSELLSRLRVERAQGYAVASEEAEVGLTSVGVPVRDRNDSIIAVVNVSGPTSRLVHRVEDIAKLLKSASTAIRRNLELPATPAAARRRRG